MDPADWKGGQKLKYSGDWDDAVRFEGHFDLNSRNCHYSSPPRSRTQVSRSPVYEWRSLRPHIFLKFRRNLKGRCSKFHPVNVNSAGIQVLVILIILRVDCKKLFCTHHHAGWSNLKPEFIWGHTRTHNMPINDSVDYSLYCDVVINSVESEALLVSPHFITRSRIFHSTKLHYMHV